MAIVPPNAQTRLGDFRPIVRASEGTVHDVRILLACPAPAMTNCRSLLLPGDEKIKGII